MLDTRDLMTKLHGLLRAHAAGVSEYELLERFGATGWEDELEMFRAHFLLFHALYRLRAEVEREGTETLHIQCMRIALAPYAPPAPGSVGATDPLAAYYLDTANLDGTSAADVQRLLRSFWKHFEKDGARRQALEVLGLADPVDRQTIKRRYRSLAKVHHPDLGGRAEDLAALNAAMDALK